MKVAIFSEADRDELAVRILIEGILGKATLPVSFPQRPNGWNAVKRELPGIIKHLHYREVDAVALVVVADADNAPLHKVEHEQPSQTDARCRFCTLQQIARATMAALKPIPERPLLKIAIGIAVPTIEAWLLCGIDQRGAEAAWHQNELARVGSSYRNVLKKAIYGSEIAPQSTKNQITHEAATRLAQDISLLETHFPIGFGLLANAIRNW